MGAYHTRSANQIFNGPCLSGNPKTEIVCGWHKYIALYTYA